MLLLKTKRTCMSQAENHDWSLTLRVNFVAQIILHVSVPYSIIYLRLAMRLDLLGTDRASLMEELLKFAYGELLPVVLIEKDVFSQIQLVYYRHSTCFVNEEDGLDAVVYITFLYNYLRQLASYSQLHFIEAAILFTLLARDLPNW